MLKNQTDIELSPYQHFTPLMASYLLMILFNTRDISVVIISNTFDDVIGNYNN